MIDKRTLYIAIFIITGSLMGVPAVFAQVHSDMDSLIAESSSGHVGDSVAINIMMVNSITVGGFSLNIYYDDFKIMPYSLELLDRALIFDIMGVDTLQPGLLRAFAVSGHPILRNIDPGRGYVIRIWFHIIDNASPGQAYFHFENGGTQPYVNALSDSTGMVLIFPILVDGFVDVLSPSSIKNPGNLGPSSFQLSCYPNPFNSRTIFSFDSIDGSDAVIEIYDLLGRKIRSFDCGTTISANRLISWDGRDERGQEVSSGIYCYTLFLDGSIILTKKMVLQR